MGCFEINEVESTITGHLIEGSTCESVPNVRVTLYDDSKIYAVVFSDENGMFSMATPALTKDYKYSLSFQWSSIYPSKIITIENIPVNYDLHDFVVYDQSNPYQYEIFEEYMIHKTLPGEYTFFEAKQACESLIDGYDDWMLPEADYLDRLAAERQDIVNKVADGGWYWSSWILGVGDLYYLWINLSNGEEAYTSVPYEKVKVLPVRLIN